MKNLLYFIENQSINPSAIWADCSIFLFILLLLCVMAVIVIAKNYHKSLQDEYMLRTTVKMAQLTVLFDQLTEENKKLSQSVRRRDEKGHFIPITGKGHKKRDWTTATEKELITEAKRRYKKGDTLICLHEYDEVTLDNENFEFCGKAEMWGHGEKINALIFNHGVWSKKVPAKS